MQIGVKMKHKWIIGIMIVTCILGMTGCGPKENKVETYLISETADESFSRKTSKEDDTTTSKEQKESTKEMNTTTGILTIEGIEEEVKLNVVQDELGFTIGYDPEKFVYESDSQNHVASFTAENPASEIYPNIFLSVSKSEFNKQETIDGLKLQAFTEQINQEDTKIGKDKLPTTKITMIGGEEYNSRIADYYVVEWNKEVYIVELDCYVEAQEGYGARLNMMLDTLQFAK